MKKLLFVTNQFRTGGVESVFYQLASCTQREIDLLPVHESFDDYLVRRLPDNVRVIESGINPERSLPGLFVTLRRAWELRKEFGGQD